MKKLEYIWLDGYKPEPMLRSKVKVIDGEIQEIKALTCLTGPSTVLRHNKRKGVTLTAYSDRLQLTQAH